MDLDPVFFPDAGDDIQCPMPCGRCQDLGPNSCEDCLDCLLWPEVVPPRATHVPAPPGRTAPTMSESLRRHRESLDVGARVGLVSRRFRREHGLSQRGLAEAIGWSQASLNRAEQDAAPLTLRKVEVLLRHLGYRLAIVPADTNPATTLGEDLDEAWGAPDLLARDAAGRRPPPYGQVTWNSVLDRRLYARVLKHETEWTWQRPRTLSSAPSSRPDGGSWGGSGSRRIQP